jgi:hypothetical protein
MRSLPLVALSLLFTIHTSATTFAVISNADSGTGSLRWAIEQSNTAPGRDEIAWSDALTIALQSPLPPITDAVTIGSITPVPEPGDPFIRHRPPVLTVDGSATHGNGLAIAAGGVIVSSIALRHFGSGDAIVVNGDNAVLNWIDEWDAVNGLHIRGRRASVFGSKFQLNAEAGLWIDASSGDNTIGRPDVGCPPVGDPCYEQPTGDDFSANGTGMRVDGEHNQFCFIAADDNRGDGVVITARDNPLDTNREPGAHIDRSGRNAVTFLAPAFPPVSTSCSGATVFDVGNDGPTPYEDRAKFRLAVPRITAATTYPVVTVVNGVAHAAPNAKVIITLYVSSLEKCGMGLWSRTLPDVSKAFNADAHGDVSFELRITPATGSQPIYVQATELDAAGIAAASSELSDAFTPATMRDRNSDLETTITAPQTAPVGSIITVEIRMTNHGPAPVTGTRVDVNYPASVSALRSTTTSGKCIFFGGKYCSLGILMGGETAIIRETVRVERGEASRAYTATATFGSDPSPVDLNPANNSATATIATPGLPRSRAVRH